MCYIKIAAALGVHVLDKMFRGVHVVETFFKGPCVSMCSASTLCAFPRSEFRIKLAISGSRRGPCDPPKDSWMGPEEPFFRVGGYSGRPGGLPKSQFSLFRELERKYVGNLVSLIFCTIRAFAHIFNRNEGFLWRRGHFLASGKVAFLESRVTF